MTESEDPSIPENFESVRFVGTLGMVAGVIFSFGILVFGSGPPPWPWLVGLWVLALVGVGLRIEAGVRERRRS
ncbi:hypothetical protein ACIBG8_30825 [Nonomuraea sp. NPDC050556]|uniref:hypothetical protein n=1 Tax=Nonomuraea sp. NPDC050556 TaxID=3364369 RepID=UPI0037A39861